MISIHKMVWWSEIIKIKDDIQRIESFSAKQKFETIWSFSSAKNEDFIADQFPDRFSAMTVTKCIYSNVEWYGKESIEDTSDEVWFMSNDFLLIWEKIK